MSESDESTPTAVIQPAVSSTRPCLYARVPAAQLSTLSASVRSHSCIPSHARLLNNVSHPSDRQLLTITVQYHSKNPFLFAELLSLLLLSMPPHPHSTTLVSLCSVYCSSWMKNGLEGGAGARLPADT